LIVKGAECRRLLESKGPFDCWRNQTGKSKFFSEMNRCVCFSLRRFKHTTFAAIVKSGKKKKAGAPPQCVGQFNHENKDKVFVSSMV